MSLTVGTNSWVTVAEADSYFSDRYGSSAWSGLTNTEKEQLLITAYRWIQQQSIFSISPSSTSEIVKQAQFETAWFIYNWYDEYQKRQALYAQGVRSFRISSFSENLEKPEFPSFISDMLEDFITSDGSFFDVEREFESNQG